MKLSDRKWEPFTLEEIFDIKSGRRLESYNFIPGNRPFIGATDNRNGITNFVSNENDSLDKNVLGVNYNGNGMVISFYHPYECIFTDDVKRFHLRDIPDDEYVFLFFKTIILQQKKKYSYGYKFNENRMKRQIILIPVTDDGKPDYCFMHDYIKQKKKSFKNAGIRCIKEKIANIEYVEIKELSNIKWHAFFIGGHEGIFNLCATKSGIDKNKLIPSDNLTVPYITRSDLDNGYNMFVGKEQKVNYSIDDGNVITIGLDTQTVFYQPYKFYTGQNIQVLSNDNLNEYNALFIATLLKKQLKKFNWGGNGATLGRLVRTKILLPALDDEKPDYEYMTQYVKNKMIAQCRTYLKR